MSDAGSDYCCIDPENCEQPGCCENAPLATTGELRIRNGSCSNCFGPHDITATEIAPYHYQATRDCNGTNYTFELECITPDSEPAYFVMRIYPTSNPAFVSEVEPLAAVVFCGHVGGAGSLTVGPTVIAFPLGFSCDFSTVELTWVIPAPPPPLVFSQAKQREGFEFDTIRGTSIKSASLQMRQRVARRIAKLDTCQCADELWSNDSGKVFCERQHRYINRMEHELCKDHPLVRLRQFDLGNLRRLDPDFAERERESGQIVPIDDIALVLAMPGVGTSCHKRLKGFGFEVKPYCKCISRIRAMNEHGVAWCMKNRKLILDWFEESAADYRVPSYLHAVKMKRVAAWRYCARLIILEPSIVENQRAQTQKHA